MNKNASDNENPTNVNSTINSLDSFYSTNVSSKYKDVRTLDKSYNKVDAQLDNCFVVGAMVHNDYLYSSFISNYGNLTSAFIRVVQSLNDYSIVIYDIQYDADSDKVLIVEDNTRDNSISEEDRNITLKEFNYIGEYEFDGSLYWVAFNDSITDENFYSANTFIITKIN